MRIQTFLVPALAASVLAACGSRGGSQDSAPPPPPEPPKPVVSCVAKPVPAPAAATGAKAKTTRPAPAKPAAKGKKATAASSSSASSVSSAAAPATVAADAEGKCPAGYDAVISAPAAQASSASASSSSQASKDGDRPSRQVKSDDGSVEGTVYGSPAAGSKLARVKIGMTEGEVRKAIGEPDDISSYVTGKAFIPFYFGNDSARVEWIYSGLGSIAFNAGGFGGRRVVMMINHDPKMR